MNLYYNYEMNCLWLYSDKEGTDLVGLIPNCMAGENLLLTIEDYFEKENIKYEFKQLIPL
jgi:hypothetical protein